MSFGGFGSFGTNQQQQQQQQQQSNPFGGGSTGGGFGSTFGAPAAGGGGFGSTTTSGFGSTNSFGSSNAFGQSGQQSGGFGQTGGFGAPASTGSFGQAPAAQGGFANVSNPNNDYEIPRDQHSATDSISRVVFSPVAGSNLLLVASWDNKVRCYDVQDNGSMLKADLRAFITHDAPVLDVCFKDGTGCFTCGCDNVVKAWQFESNPGLQNATVVGKHDAPIKSCRWIPEKSLLATAGWDGKLLYWDLRTPNPVLTCQMPNNARIDCMDVKFPYCVVGTGGSENDRQILIYNLGANPSQPERILNQVAPAADGTPSPHTKVLKRQYRTITVFPDKTGFAVASIEGRCSIQYFGINRLNDNFAFKCHRDKNSKRIYVVNEISFHNQIGIFSSCGSDGVWNFWDKDCKQRLKASSQIKMQNNDPAPITSTCFSSSGRLFAYAVSYDWSKGASQNPQQNISTVMIHRVEEGEVQPKKPAATNTRRY